MKHINVLCNPEVKIGGQVTVGTGSEGSEGKVRH